MYLNDMAAHMLDIIGSIFLGFTIGVAVTYKIVRMIARKNKKRFLSNLANYREPDKEMLLDSISSGLDELIPYNGQKVLVSDQRYAICWIGYKNYLLPIECLKPTNKTKESD